MMGWPEIVVLAYLVLNLIAFIAFVLDKRSAERHGARTSERRLLLLSLLGPFGAFAAMRLFRHKTRKRKFFLVPAFMVVHLVAILFIFYRLFGDLHFT
jgi:uncharacterized membrane protein YsdA (DUF1294 family)